jgi:hypothetical protein
MNHVRYSLYYGEPSSTVMVSIPSLMKIKHLNPPHRTQMEFKVVVLNSDCSILNKIYIAVVYLCFSNENYVAEDWLPLLYCYLKQRLYRKCMNLKVEKVQVKQNCPCNRLWRPIGL